jgi:hypothetical protein
MDHTRHVIIWSPKGGQGTTVFAAMNAIHTAQQGNSVALVGDLDELTRVIPTDVPGLSLMDMPDRPGQLVTSFDFMFFDAGRDIAAVDDLVPDTNRQRLMVVKNCYLALSAAIRVQTIDDDLIAVIEPHRALSLQDVIAALGRNPQMVLSWDPGIARAVDAGMLAIRPLIKEYDNHA